MFKTSASLRLHFQGSEAYFAWLLLGLKRPRNWTLEAIRSSPTAEGCVEKDEDEESGTEVPK